MTGKISYSFSTPNETKQQKQTKIGSTVFFLIKFSGIKIVDFFHYLIFKMTYIFKVDKNLKVLISWACRPGRDIRTRSVMVPGN